jgi:hypothetical protein
VDDSGLSARRLVHREATRGPRDKDFVYPRPALSGEIQPKRAFRPDARAASVANRGRPRRLRDREKPGQNPYRAASIGDLVSLTAIPESDRQGDNLLRKIGSQPKLIRMTNPAFRTRPDPALPGFSCQRRADQRRAEENFSAKNPRNPLKSLDSDERIQGNPRKSNPPGMGFSRRNRDRPRKPKRSDRTTVDQPRKEPDRRRQTAKRFSETAPRAAPSSGGRSGRRSRSSRRRRPPSARGSRAP